ncbi:MAG TPA: hypothetical protein VK658_14585 [Chryseolinea sp.]|nr:hypothetical protein [Chryseolinea sp.]
MLAVALTMMCDVCPGQGTLSQVEIDAKKAAVEGAKNMTEVGEKFVDNVVPKSDPADITGSELDKFFATMRENYLAVRQAKLSVSRRIRGIRAAQNAGIKKIKIAYDNDIYRLTNQNKTDAEIDEELRELKARLPDIVFQFRTMGNSEYRIAYDRWDTKTVKFLPARNARIAQLYYNELKNDQFLTFLRSQFLAFNDDYGALSSELVAGYLGPFRTSLSTAITKAKEVKIEDGELEGKTPEQIQALVNENYQENLSNSTLANVVAGGGLLGLKAQYPLIDVSKLWTDWIKFDNELVGTFSGQFDAAGTETPENKTSLWGSYGIENTVYIPVPDFIGDKATQAFGIFAQYNIRHVSGSGTFENSLGIEKGFWMSEFKAGLFYSGIQITYKYLNFSNKTLDGQYQNSFAITYAPQKSKEK